MAKRQISQTRWEKLGKRDVIWILGFDLAMLCFMLLWYSYLAYVAQLGVRWVVSNMLGCVFGMAVMTVIAILMVEWDEVCRRVKRFMEQRKSKSKGGS